MGSVPPLLSFLLMLVSGWMHRLLFVINLAERVVDVLGVTARPDARWMLQIGRNVIDCDMGALREKRYLIIDRDTKYKEQFRRLIEDAGTQVIRLPPMSPNLNAYAFARLKKHA
jgi:putative transposase